MTCNRGVFELAFSSSEMENNLKMDCIEIFVLYTVAITVMDSPTSIYALTAALLTRNTHREDSPKREVLKANLGCARSCLIPV